MAVVIVKIIARGKENAEAPKEHETRTQYEKRSSKDFVTSGDVVVPVDDRQTAFLGDSRWSLEPQNGGVAHGYLSKRRYFRVYSAPKN